MNMPGGTRPLHSISPGLYPPGDVGDGEAVHSATGHLSPATAWCQCGQSVDTDRGPGPGDPVHSVSNVWPGPGQCGLCCGAVVVMLSGQPGRPGRDQSSSLSPLSARPQTGGFVASGRPHRPKCASVHSGKTEGCEAEMHNAQENAQGNRTKGSNHQ